MHADPVVIGMSGLIYLAAALALDARFLFPGLGSSPRRSARSTIRTFRFSITYLMALFGAFIADHYCKMLVVRMQLAPNRGSRWPQECRLISLADCFQFSLY